jgi:hypothetical protein
MTRISSTKATFFYKRIFPFLWFGALLLIVAFGLLSPSRDSQASNIPFLIVPVLMGVFSYRFMQKMVFCLADEVLDAGDALVVRNGGQQERISLSDIKNVNYQPYMSPPQITLSLRRPTVFGDTVVFCGPVSLMPISSDPSPAIKNLIDRIDSAHQKR